MKDFVEHRLTAIKLINFRLLKCTDESSNTLIDLKKHFCEDIKVGKYFNLLSDKTLFFLSMIQQLLIQKEDYMNRFEQSQHGFEPTFIQFSRQ
jgi:hypothetical protein